jgi:hypothetical protein
VGLQWRVRGHGGAFRSARENCTPSRSRGASAGCAGAERDARTRPQPGPPPRARGTQELTLTNLYNRTKAGELTWLANAHEKLDRAVFAAYGWPYPLEDQEILSRLLAENVHRASPAPE